MARSPLCPVVPGRVSTLTLSCRGPSSFLMHFLDTEAVDKGGSVGRNPAGCIPRGQGTAGGHAHAAPGHPRGPQRVPVLEPAPTSTTASLCPLLNTKCMKEAAKLLFSGAPEILAPGACQLVQALVQILSSLGHSLHCHLAWRRKGDPWKPCVGPLCRPRTVALGLRTVLQKRPREGKSHVPVVRAWPLESLPAIGPGQVAAHSGLPGPGPCRAELLTSPLVRPLTERGASAP